MKYYHLISGSRHRKISHLRLYRNISKLPEVIYLSNDTDRNSTENPHLINIS